MMAKPEQDVGVRSLAGGHLRRGEARVLAGSPSAWMVMSSRRIAEGIG